MKVYKLEIVCESILSEDTEAFEELHQTTAELAEVVRVMFQDLANDGMIKANRTMFSGGLLLPNDIAPDFRELIEEAKAQLNKQTAASNHPEAAKFDNLERVKETLSYSKSCIDPKDTENDEYLRGFYNALELVEARAQGREPDFITEKS